ncbi:AAA family ATPase [Bernardetia sp.]|uniref:AAA family ATPase n=1 Tax=Bernardetia sp. TaxID=1937974 RepID=UPI0025BE0188|nr:AAA family ATPase [Bernardetia sp.]
MGRNSLNSFNTLQEVAQDFRKTLTGDNRKEKKIVLLFAHNGTGKTRLSMEFKDLGKADGDRDTLYYNSFTEDLFIWNNDLENDTVRFIQFNQESIFFDGVKELNLDTKIAEFLSNYIDLDFAIDYQNSRVSFSRKIKVGEDEEIVENIKISRGEESLFRWCFFMAICELAIDKDPTYDWVKYVYVDDPISSLDENNAIAMACDLGSLISRPDNEIKFVVSTHHSLFFNVMFREAKVANKRYFLHFKSISNTYALQDTTDTPFFHHIATLSELKQIADSNIIYTYHFNALRSILEKTASFFGYDEINNCIHGLDDEVLFHRALQLFSHGKYSIYDPVPMGEDTKDLFKQILDGFLTKYEFDFPQIFNEELETESE